MEERGNSTQVFSTRDRSWHALDYRDNTSEAPAREPFSGSFSDEEQRSSVLSTPPAGRPKGTPMALTSSSHEKLGLKQLGTCIALALPWVAFYVLNSLFQDTRVTYMKSLSVHEFFPRFGPPLIGFFIAPILGAASDRSLSSMGRRNFFLTAAAVLMFLFGILYGSAKAIFPEHRLVIVLVFIFLNLGFAFFDIALRARIMDDVPLEYQVHAQAAVSFWSGVGGVIGMAVFRDGSSLTSPSAIDSQEILVTFSASAAAVLVTTFISIYLKPERPQRKPFFQPPLRRLAGEAWEQILYSPKLFRILCVVYFVLYFAWWSFRDQSFTWWGENVYEGCRASETNCSDEGVQSYRDGMNTAVWALVCQNALRALISFVFLFLSPSVPHANVLNRVATIGLSIGTVGVIVAVAVGKHFIPVAFGGYVATAFFHTVVFIFPFSVVGIMGKEMQESADGFNNNGLYIGVLTMFQSVAELTVQVYGSKNMAPLGTGNVMALSCTLFILGTISTAAFKFAEERSNSDYCRA